MKGFLVFIGILLLYGNLFYAQEDKELQTLLEQLGKPEEASQAQEKILDRFRKEDSAKLWPFLKTLSTPALKGLVDILGQLGDARCCESLAPLAKHTESSIRLATVLALAQFDKAGLTVMEANLSDTDLFVAGTAGYYFLKASVKSEQATQSLSRAVKEVSDTNALLKLLQYLALLKKDDITLGKALLTPMNNEDPKVRESAWKAFREGFPQSPEFNHTSSNSADRNKEIGALRDWLNARLIPLFIEKLTVGEEAEKAYQELKSRGLLVLPELEKGLAHPNESVRKNCLLLTVELATRENALKSVLKLFSEDPSDLVRLTAIQIYEQSGEEAGTSVLEKTLETEKNAKIREKVVLTLIKFDTKKQSLNRILTLLLKDPEEAVRLACLKFLEKVEADATVTRLLGISAGEDASYRVRVQALQLLYQPQWNATEQAKAILLAIFSANEEGWKQLQTTELLKTLVSLASEKQVQEVCPIVLEKLNTSTPESLAMLFPLLTTLAPNLEISQLEALLPYLSHESEEIRSSAYAFFAKHWKSQIVYTPRGTPAERQAQLQKIQEEIALHKDWPALKNAIQNATTPSPVEEDRLKQAGLLAQPLLLKELPEAGDALTAAIVRVLRTTPSETVLEALIQKLAKNPSEGVLLEMIPTLNVYSQKTAEDALMRLLENPSSKIRDGVIDTLVQRSGSGTQLLEKLKSLAQQTTGLARIRLEIAIFASEKEEDRFFKESLLVFTQSKDDPKVGEAYQAFLDFVFNADSPALFNRLLDPEVLKEGTFRLEFLKRWTPEHRKHLNFLRWNTLIPLLSHAEIPVREATIQGLQNLLGENYGYTSAGTTEERHTAITAFEERWKEQQRTLAFEEEFAKFQTEIQKENWESVRKILEKKTEKDHADFYSKLISFLTAPELSNSAKTGVIELLTSRTYTSAELQNQLTEALGKLLEKETPVSLQHSAIIGLRNFSQTGVTEQLRNIFAKQLTNPDTLIRFYAVMALAWSASPENVTLLVPSLKDTDPKVRIEAAYALTSLHPREALTQLALLLKDSQESVRKVALTLIVDVARSLKKASAQLNQKVRDIPLIEKDFQERGSKAFAEVSAYLSGFYSTSNEATQKQILEILKTAFGAEQVETLENKINLKPILLKGDSSTLLKNLEPLKPILEQEVHSESLADALKEESLAIRMEAIKGIAGLKNSNEALIQALSLSLNGDDAIYLQKALDQIGRLAKTELDALPENKKLPLKFDVTKPKKERDEFLADWRKLRIRSLCTKLGSKDLAVKNLARQHLKEFKDKVALDCLVEEINLQKGELANPLIALVGELQNESIVAETKTALSKMLEIASKEDGVKTEALVSAYLSIPSAKTEETVKQWSALLEASKEELAQVSLAVALHQWGVSQRDLLSKTLRSSEVKIRLATIAGIEKLGDSKVSSLLNEAIDTEKDDTVLLALLTSQEKTLDVPRLLTIGKRAPGVAKNIATMLTKKTGENLGEDISAWDQWWNQKEKDRLLKLLRAFEHTDRDQVHRALDETILTFGEKALPLLQEALKDPKIALGDQVKEIQQIREFAVKGIARLQKGARESLETFILDTDPVIQREVIEALLALNDKNALVALQKVPETSSNYLYACQVRYQLGEEAILSKITETLKSENPRQREMGYGILVRLKIQLEQVAQTLAQEKDIRALIFGIQCLEMAKNPIANDVLIQNLLHADRFVRKNALSALKTINGQDFGFDYRRDPKEQEESHKKWLEFEKQRKEKK